VAASASGSGRDEREKKSEFLQSLPASLARLPEAPTREWLLDSSCMRPDCQCPGQPVAA
jgi:hypothetical protein